MSNYFVIGEDGSVHDLPECENCGCPILRPGLCGTCARVAEEVDHITQVSQEIPDCLLINPEDLR